MSDGNQGLAQPRSGWTRLGDWSWPGQGGAAAAEVLPPPWVPAFPPRREPRRAAPAPRRRARCAPAADRRRCSAPGGRLHGRWPRRAGSTSSSSSGCARATPRSDLARERSRRRPARCRRSSRVSHDAAGSSIDSADYALGGAARRRLIPRLPAARLRRARRAHTPSSICCTATASPPPRSCRSGCRKNSTA